MADNSEMVKRAVKNIIDTYNNLFYYKGLLNRNNPLENARDQIYDEFESIEKAIKNGNINSLKGSLEKIRTLSNQLFGLIGNAVTTANKAVYSNLKELTNYFPDAGEHIINVAKNVMARNVDYSNRVKGALNNFNTAVTNFENAINSGKYGNFDAVMQSFLRVDYILLDVEVYIIRCFENELKKAIQEKVSNKDYLKIFEGERKKLLAEKAKIIKEDKSLLGKIKKRVGELF